MDVDVVMKDMEESSTRYPVLEAEWAAGDPQTVADDFIRMVSAASVFGFSPYQKSVADDFTLCLPFSGERKLEKVSSP